MEETNHNKSHGRKFTINILNDCETKLIIYPLSWLKLCAYTILKAPLPNTSSYYISMPHKSGKNITFQFLKKSCLKNHKNQALKKISRKPLSLHDNPCKTCFIMSNKHTNHERASKIQEK
jgi:hypothetical protein